MSDSNLYSIGHGRRAIADFLSLLQRYDISYLVDIRSVPYSRFNPQYRQPVLKEHLADANIHYVFMGDSLGGRPLHKDCYDINGRVDYNKIRERDFYKEGIRRLIKGCQSGKGIAIMCSESKPEECHRSRLVGVTLAADADTPVDVRHIDENGVLLNQAEVMKRMKK